MSSSEQVKPSLVLPQELNFSKKSSFRSSIVRRDNVSRNATGSATASSNSVVTFEIPSSNNHAIDLGETYFSVTLNTSSSASRLDDIRDCIRAVRIMSDNGQELEHLQAFNVLNRVVLYSHYPDDYLDHVEVAAGREPNAVYVYSQANFANTLQSNAAIAPSSVSTNAVVRRVNEGALYEANSSLASPGKYYVFRLEGSGFLNSHMYWPLMLGGLRIEFELESDAIALSAAAETYTWSTPQIHYSTVMLSDQVSAALANAVKSGKMLMTYSTFSWQTAAQTSTDTTVTISKPYNRTKGIFAVRRATSALVAAADSFNFANTEFSHYQWKHGDSYIPVSRVDQLKRAYYEFRKAVGTFGSYSDSATPYLDYIGSTRGRFIIAVNLETILSDPLSGASLSNGAFVDLQLATSGSTAHRMDIFTHYIQGIQVNPDKSLKIIV